jgi:ATP-dependent DNA helicase RecQ
VSLHEKALHILKTVFGYETFRSLQAQIVESVLTGHDTLALLPTGGGKSLCYQVPGLVLPGATLVISPLIALMEDQVGALQRRGIPAAFLTSQQTQGEQQVILDQATAGKLKFLYVSPERLKSPRFIELCQKAFFSLIAVDEAHCISSWGHDFRPAYRNIQPLYKHLSYRPPVIALTATATAQVQTDICQSLQLKKPQIFAQPFRRPNLRFWSRTCKHQQHKKLLFFQILQQLKGAGVVYTLTRETCSQLGATLEQLGKKVGIYHGGLSSSTRSNVLTAFLANEVEIVIATNAFGMGVDKPNVRWVIHWQVPANLENYYQEAGRAGRDGQPADCFLLYCPEDLEIHQQIWSIGQPKVNQKLEDVRQQKLQQMVAYTHTRSCRENFILKYFNQVPSWAGCHHCDWCQKLLLPSSAAIQKELFALAEIERRVHLPEGIYLSLNLQQTIAIFGQTQPWENIPGVGWGFAETLQPFFAKPKKLFL